MKKHCFSVIFVLAFLVAPVIIKAQAQASAFTGPWVLDREKTGTNKNFPEKLKNYKMLVGESENLLNVKARVEGPVPVEPLRDRSSNTGGGITSGGGRTTAPSMGVSGTSQTSTVTEKSNYGGTMALYFTPSEATYNLNGEEVKVEIKEGEKVAGIARMKAKMDKTGKAMQLITIRRMKTPNGEVEITTRESWKLSEDGKSIKVIRTVESPSFRDEITMILSKLEQKPS